MIKKITFALVLCFPLGVKADIVAHSTPPQTADAIAFVPFYFYSQHFGHFGTVAVASSSPALPITASLDTAASTVTFGAMSWSVPASSSSTTVVFETIIPPSCNLNVCTPAQTTTESFTYTVSLAPITVDMLQTTVPVTDVGQTSATVALVPKTNFQISSSGGSWMIEGPTETASGSFNSVVDIAPLIGGEISLERTPPNTGPVTSWTGMNDVVRLVPPTFSEVLASGVVVDGHEFTAQVIPEPSAFVFMSLIFIATVAFCYSKRRPNSLTGA